LNEHGEKTNFAYYRKTLKTKVEAKIPCLFKAVSSDVCKFVIFTQGLKILLLDYKAPTTLMRFRILFDAFSPIVHTKTPENADKNGGF